MTRASAARVARREAGAFRPDARLGASPPSARPGGRLARWLRAAGHADPEAQAEDALARLTVPGRAAVGAAGHLHRRLPPAGRLALLADAFARRVDRGALQILLAGAWRTPDCPVPAAAGDAATLASWFARADFATGVVPPLAGLVDMAALPERTTLYRAGLGAPARVAQGSSWTPDPALAAFFAVLRAGQAGGRGVPALVRREVGRGAVAAYFRSLPEEAVVLGPGPWEPVATGAEAMRALADEGHDRMAWRCAVEDAAPPGRVDEAAWAAWEGGPGSTRPGDAGR